MTKETVESSVICAAILLSAGLLLSAQQSTSEPSTKSISQKQTSKSPLDNWQKMKDCAAQAEKAIAERNRRSISLGGHGSDGSTNHPSRLLAFLFLAFLVGVPSSV
jgi:hypothetical protein